MKGKAFVKGEDSEGKTYELVVKRPNSTQLRDAQLISSGKFREAINSGAMTREGIDTYMRENGLWDDAKQTELQDLAKEIAHGERQLKAGGKNIDTEKKFSLKDARDLALKIRKLRFDQTMMLAKMRELDQYTVQGQVENAKFDYLVSVCTYEKNGDPHFKNLLDYEKKAEEPYVIEAVRKLADILFEFDPDFDSKQIENRFLKDQGFVDDELHLINVDGHKVDTEGRLVNDEGRFVDKDGKFVDINGDPLDEEGNPVEEFVAFEVSDDDPKGYKSVKKKGRPKKLETS